MSKLKIVLKYWMGMKEYLFSMLLGSVLTALVNVMGAQVTLMIGELLDNIDDIQNRIPPLLVILLAMIIISIIAQCIISKAFNGSFTKIMDKFTDKVLSVDYNLYTKESASGIDTLSEYGWRIVRVGKRISELIVSLVSIVTYIVAIYKVKKEIMLPILVIYLIGGVLMKYAFKKFDEIDTQADKFKKKRNQELDDIINGFIEVKSFGMQKIHQMKFHELNNNTYGLFMKRTVVDASISGIFQLIDNGATILGVLYVVSFIIKGEMSPTEGMVIISLIGSIIHPLSAIVDFMNTASENLSMLDVYDNFMNYQNITKTEGDIELNSFNDSIKISNVSFKYGDSDNILNDINITINKGQKIGICGISGGGKSSLFKLLNHFYDPECGSILIDGIDMKNITDESLRKRIGCVHQDNFIFPGSIRKNITYGSKGYTDNDIIDACKKANIYNFIMELTDKFDTEVGPRGLKLSGGQKQRIALARVILRNPDIILLDEATSALDTESEFHIQKAIENMGDEKTIISIAHRLSTIENCDTIYVFGKGKIIESGTHEQLMNLNISYAKMYNKQYEERI